MLHRSEFWSPMCNKVSKVFTLVSGNTIRRCEYEYALKKFKCRCGNCAYSNRGIVEKTLGNYSGARRDFSSAVDLDPWRAENLKEDSRFKFRLYINLGDIQMYFKEFDKALITYGRAAEIDPRNLDVAGFKGNAIIALGNVSEGLKLRQESFGFVSFDMFKGVSIIHGRAQ